VKVARRRVGTLVRIRCLPALQGSAGSAWDVLSMGPQRNLRRLKSMNPQYQVWQALISTPTAIPYQIGPSSSHHAPLQTSRLTAADYPPLKACLSPLPA